MPEEESGPGINNTKFKLEFNSNWIETLSVMGWIIGKPVQIREDWLYTIKLKDGR